MASSSGSFPPSPMFAGEHYDLWKIVKNGSNPAPLPDNPTAMQIRFHIDEVVEEGRALVIIQTALHDNVFIKIVSLETTKEAWDKLNEKFQGSERTRRIRC